MSRGVRGPKFIKMPHVEVELEWERSLSKEFNVLTVGKIFREGFECLVVGGSDGLITVYEIPKKTDEYNVSLKELIKLETKGGPIQALCLHDITKFGSVDLIVADSRGTLTFFGNKQILNKMTMSEGCIVSVAIDVDTAQNMSIVAGDSKGNIMGCLPHFMQWRLRLNDLMTSSNKGAAMATVTSLLPIKLPTSSAVIGNYVLVADSNQTLHVLQNGVLVRNLDMPSTVNAMCAGYFLEGLDTGTSNSSHTSMLKGDSVQQISLGMEDVFESSS
ncbi:uncharacterized protein LOC124442003 isoform X2 [Xenia sp. Carnegie-2017]|uniref:uncharacterized protein LOC124442003 isoform X2 n=1 Tax=Xenia sp. Carnegie-2017 TaxID=2897299 RepID=UPI001F03C1BA|nr:uncharacterized protein LOC124442003 isoform X2 [Xenia sp. Carnegie-2017]